MIIIVLLLVEHAVSSELQLKLFATITLDQPGNISLVYLEGENDTTVWPSKCSDSEVDKVMSAYDLF